MKNFDKPIKVNDTDLAFGGVVRQLMPEMKDIPEDFKRGVGDARKWHDWQSKWFFSGLKEEDLPTPKDGIDLNTAMRHLGAIQSSFSPKHEHKQSAVAWLASKWFV